MSQSKREEKVKKFISLFQSLGDKNKAPVKPDSIVTDDPSWDQSEEAYQQEQEHWMEEVRKKKSRLT